MRKNIAELYLIVINVKKYVSNEQLRIKICRISKFSTFHKSLLVRASRITSVGMMLRSHTAEERSSIIVVKCVPGPSPSRRTNSAPLIWLTDMVECGLAAANRSDLRA